MRLFSTKSGRAGVAIWLAVAGAIGLVAWGHHLFAQEAARVEAAPQGIAAAQALSEAFQDIVRKTRPAVVSITVTATPKKQDQRMERQEINPEDLPEPLREFFKDRRFMPFERQPSRPRRQVPRRGMGSGVIIDAGNGYIITNNHVVESAEGAESRIDVRLTDTTSVLAKIVGRDPKTDLALLKIGTDGLKLHELALGDSDKIQVGEVVLAIGSPFGLTQTVTQGIVSATGRTPMIIEGYEDFIQTDAAINPGNSGGPLLNLKGEVIGINTAIVTSGLSAGYMGVGFAVPSATVKDLLPLWKEGKEIVRGYLGVEIKGLKDAFEPGIGKTYGLDEDKGILVEHVFPDAPGAKAGLKAEDVILTYDGKEVTTVADLQRRVANTEPGKTIDMKVWRDRKEITIPVRVEKQPEDFSPWSRGGRPDREGDASDTGETEIASLGLTVAPVSQELAKKLGWEDEKDLTGANLIVTDVEPLGEAAAGLGINAGDLILTVQGKAIKTGEELKQALGKTALAVGVRLRIKDVETKRTRTLFARSHGE
ncbi:MAG TPA: trypsin-like peptidase domain-containing protein [Phycisphaerae bacterium]|nr:trypsin-like peptidase domain-containing protein [Phycisphaerae bacterium]